MSSVRGNRSSIPEFQGGNTARSRRTVNDELSLDLETNPNLIEWKKGNSSSGFERLGDQFAGDDGTVDGVYFLDGWMDNMTVQDEDAKAELNHERVDLDVLQQQGDQTDVQNSLENGSSSALPRVSTNKKKQGRQTSSAQPSPYSIHIQQPRKSTTSTSVKRSATNTATNIPKPPKQLIVNSKHTQQNDLVNPFNEQLPVNVLNAAEQARVNRELMQLRQENAHWRKQYAQQSSESNQKLKSITVELTNTSKKLEQCEQRLSTQDEQFEQRMASMLNETQSRHDTQLIQARRQTQMLDQAFHNKSTQLQQESTKSQSLALRLAELEDRMEGLRLTNGELTEKISIGADREQRLQVQLSSKDVQQNDQARKCEELIQVERNKIGELLEGYQELESHIHRQEQVLCDAQKETERLNQEHAETTRILNLQIKGLQERLELRNSRSVNEVEQAVAKSISKSTMELIQMQQQVKEAEENVVKQKVECERLLNEQKDQCARVVSENLAQLEQQSRRDKADIALERARLSAVVKSLQQGNTAVNVGEDAVDNTSKDALEEYLLDFMFAGDVEHEATTLESALERHSQGLPLDKAATRVVLKTRNQQLQVFDQFTASRAYDIGSTVRQAYGLAQCAVGEDIRRSSFPGTPMHGGSSTTRLSAANSSVMLTPEKRKSVKLKPVVCSQCLHSLSPEALYHTLSLQENAKKPSGPASSNNSSALSSPSAHASKPNSLLFCETASVASGTVSTSVLPFAAQPNLAAVNIPCPLSNTPLCVSDAAQLVAHPWTKHATGHTSTLILGPAPTSDTLATLFKEPVVSHTEVHTNIQINGNNNNNNNNGNNSNNSNNSTSPMNVMKQNLLATTGMPAIVSTINEPSHNSLQTVPAWLVEWSFGRELRILQENTSSSTRGSSSSLFDNDFNQNSDLGSSSSDTAVATATHTNNWWYKCLRTFHDHIKYSIDEGRLPQKQTPWLQWIVDSCVRRNQHIFQKGMVTLNGSSADFNQNAIYDTSVLNNILRTRMGFSSPLLLKATNSTVGESHSSTFLDNNSKGHFCREHPHVYKTLLHDLHSLNSNTLRHPLYSGSCLDEMEAVAVNGIGGAANIPVPFVLQHQAGQFLMLHIQSMEAILCRQWFQKSRAVLEAALSNADLQRAQMKVEAKIEFDLAEQVLQKSIAQLHEELQAAREENSRLREEQSRVHSVDNPDLLAGASPLPTGQVLKRGSISLQHSPAFQSTRPSLSISSPVAQTVRPSFSVSTPGGSSLSRYNSTTNVKISSFTHMAVNVESPTTQPQRAATQRVSSQKLLLDEQE